MNDASFSSWINLIPHFEDNYFLLRKIQIQPGRKLHKTVNIYSIMTTETQIILKKLNSIQSELDYIKEHMIDRDTILTEEERLIINTSIKHEKEGKLVSLGDIKNVRNKTR